MEAFEDADNEKMNEIRARCDEVVQDTHTADTLKVSSTHSPPTHSFAHSSLTDSANAACM